MPPLSGSMDHYQSVATASSAPVRKCLHCEITKTPQWRAGPLGQDPLQCLGVRYKSGRLYPEYRPAKSNLCSFSALQFPQEGLGDEDQNL
ncbi:hypothetical protein MKW92_031772 [Papaver armeniacum]|nr:hypothetical protein MKW92_031772 [Papaver armeniacum]